MRRFLEIVLLAACLLFVRDASAHSVGLSRGEYRVFGNSGSMRYSFPSGDLALAFPGIDTDHDGNLSSAELDRGREALDRGIVQSTIVFADDVPCQVHLDSARQDEADAVIVQASFQCDHVVRHLAIEFTFLDRLPREHRHVATIDAGDHQTSFVVERDRKRIDVDLGDIVPQPTFGAMVWMGVTHILTGYDHLAFLLGLLLLGGQARTLVLVVSAFTVAHSITLALAVLGIVSLAPSIVEPAIALSIAYVGLENLFAPNPAKRWRITFAFGLLHGFGFAGALTRLGLPRSDLPAALFAFNLGVEFGQLGVLTVCLPLIVWARRAEAFRAWGVRALSAAVAVAGCIWFWMRVRA
jgi:hydrogenase/urease accessory protein HupE